MNEDPKSPEDLVDSIFRAALEEETAEARAAYLDRACGNDQKLRAIVESLLQYAGDEDFMAIPAEGVPHMAEFTDKEGDTIGRYHLLEKIGEGGFGVVYVAEQDKPMRRRVALKVIKLGMDTKQVIARFEAERQVLAEMDHPNIAKMMDAGATDSGRPYFVMELVDGIQVTDYCNQRKLSTAERLGLFKHVCNAIQHAHQKGIIHRDIKPSNILVAHHDCVHVPKVIDFGIAKATQARLAEQTPFTVSEQFIGTPAYMSPEQAGVAGSDIDTRSDIYALGVLLYELLTGKTPFDPKALRASGVDRMWLTIREHEPERPSVRLIKMDRADVSTIADFQRITPSKLINLVRGDLDWIVMKCLEKHRARRYDSAGNLAADVQRFLDCEPVVARPPSTMYRFRKTVRRNKVAFASAATILIALSLGLAVSLILYFKEKTAKLQTQTALRAVEDQKAKTQMALDIAQTNAGRAEVAAKEARRTLAAWDFSEAIKLIANDDNPGAVAHLSRILSADPGNRAALTRLTTLITYRSWIVPAFSLHHGDEVSSAQFSPDGKRILTASPDCPVIWDALTGQSLIHPLELWGSILWSGRQMCSAQFSPDGKRFVTASADQTARVWNAANGVALTAPIKLGDRGDSAQFSPDGQRIVTATGVGVVQVWDAQTGQPLTTPMKQAEKVYSVQFSPDSKRIITASRDKTAKVWDARTGQLLVKPLIHSGSVNSAQFSPDGKRIVTASSDHTARVWDAQTGQPLTEPLVHEGSVESAQFSPDGKYVLTASDDQTARVWDTRTGQPLTVPMQHEGAVMSAEFSPDGRYVVTASSDHTARVWSTKTGFAFTGPLEHGDTVNSAKFSPDGKSIVTSSMDRTAQVWEMTTWPPLSNPLKHGAKVNSAHFSPDGKLIVTASGDHSARVWDAQTGHALTEPLGHGDGVRDAQFSPDGERIVTASDDHTARVWDAQTGRPFTKPMVHEGAVESAQFSPFGDRLLTVSFDGFRMWAAQTGQALTEPLKPLPIVTFAQFSPDGNRIFTCSLFGNGLVFDPWTGGAIAKLSKYASGIISGQFSADGKRLLTASIDRTARVWDVQSGQALTEPLRHTDAVESAQFSPDGERIVTASDDHTARVWDAQSGRALTEPLGHGDKVKCAQFSPDGERIVTASVDGTARVWDARTGLPLTEPFTHKGCVNFAEFSPDGKSIVTASDDGTAQIWDVGLESERCPDWFLQLAEAISGCRLNKEGIVEATKLDRAKTIAEIKQRLKEMPDKANGVIWGRWLLADHSTRTISPFSNKTIAQYIEDRITENTSESLDEALNLAFGDENLLARIQSARRMIKKPVNPIGAESPPMTSAQ